MSIITLKDRKVGENDEPKKDFIKKFEQYKNLYRMCCEFEHTGDLDFKVMKNTPVIFGYGHKVAVYPIDKDTCCAHIMASINFEKKFKEKGVDFIQHEEEMIDGSIKKTGQWGENGEFILHFKMDDLPKVGDIFKFKKASKSSTNPYSVKNTHEFLRFMRNVDCWYGEILDKRIVENRVEEEGMKQENLNL
ncbi:MAG: hypothetical protein ACRDDY_04195 [Clostridium sp.]|uniref:hypothetical protein n=1 Tax=Clostridium sp. TaxID=1506 RepID=UPI003EE616DE